MDTVAVTPVRPPGLMLAMRSIHRLELAPNVSLMLAWGMFVAADRFSDLWSLASLLGFGINAVSMFSGFVLNSYSDYWIDRRTPLKAYVAHGVERVGRTAVLWTYIVEQIVTVAMAVWVSLLLNNLAFVFVKLMGILAGYLYNAEPIRLKRRGLWNPAMMAVRIGFVPGLIGYLSVHKGHIGPGGWVLLAGMTLVAAGRVGFFSTVSDTDEDRAEQIRTPSVVYGPVVVMRMGLAVLTVAAGLTTAGLALLLGPAGALGAAGCVGALLYRASLVRRASDSRAAVALMRTPAVLLAEWRWDKATYGGLILVGIAHMVIG